MKIPGNTVLVTGAQGFIGRHTLEAFRGTEHRVYGTSQAQGVKGYLHLALDDVRSMRETILSSQPDVVIHLAGVAHRRAVQEEYERINHQGTELLARTLAEHCPGSTLIYASSANVYGHGPFLGPVDEDHPTTPHDPYAISKLLGEQAALSYGSKIRVIVFRFPALYARDWLFNIRKRAYAPKPLHSCLLRLVGDRAAYSFCAIDNAVSAIRLAAARGITPGIYNLADQAVYSQADVVRLVRKYDGARLQIPVPVRAIQPLYWGVSALLPYPLRTTSRSHYHKLAGGMVLNCSRAQKAGYRPTTTLTDLI